MYLFGTDGAIKFGADVEYYDPWVTNFKEGTLNMESMPALTAKLVKSADVVLVTAAHTNVNYELVQKNAKAIFDTKNAMKDIANRENIEVL